MCINNFDNFNFGHRLQIYPPVLQLWQRVMVWRKNQTVGVFQVYGKLALSVAFKLMASGRRVFGYIGQALKRFQLIQALHELTPVFRAISPDGLFADAADFLESSCSKYYLHNGILSSFH